MAQVRTRVEPSQPGSPIEIRLLGTIAIGSAPTAVSRPKERGVLATLAMSAGAVVEVDTLVDTLWPNDPPRTAVKTLQGYIKRIRRMVHEIGRDLIHVGPAGYRLEVDQRRVDAIVFERAVAATRTARDPTDRLRQLDLAFDLWDGEPFAGCSFDRLDSHRRRLLGVRSHARLQWVTAAHSIGRTAEAVERVQAYIADEPTNERLHFHHAALAYLCGDAVQALRTISDARRILREDIGVDLGPELVELEQAILTHDDVASVYQRVAKLDPPTSRTRRVVSGAGRLPQWAGELVGRDDVIERVRSLVEARPGVVCLTGAGGIGKTRCAVEAARTVTPSCLRFIDLSSIGDAETMLEHIAAEIGAKDSDDLLDAVADGADGVRAVVILDNVEQIPAAGDTIKAIRQAAPLITWLVTSRTRLGISEEQVVEIDGLPTSADAGPATELLVQSVRRHGGHFDNADLSRFDALSRLLDGHPLALELAGCQIVRDGLDHVEAALYASDPMLFDHRRDVERHRSMAACVQAGYGLLSPPAMRILHLISAWPGGVRHGDLDGAWIAELPLDAYVAELRQLGLTTVRHDPDGGRRLVQPHALRGMATANDADSQGPLHPPDDEVLQALGRGVVRRAAASMSGSTAQVEADLPAIRMLLARGLEPQRATDRPTSMLLASLLTVYWWSCRLGEGRRWLDALAAEDDGATPTELAAHVENAAAFLDIYVGQAEAGRRRLERAVRMVEREHFGQSGRRSIAAARSLNLLAMLDAADGRFDRACELAERSIALAEQASDQQFLAVSLTNAADVSLANRDFDLAKERYLASIQCFRSVDEDWLSAAPHARLGDIALASSDPKQARLWLDRSISLWSSRPLGPGVPQAMSSMARLDIAEGRLEDASERIGTAVDIAVHHGSRGEYPWIAASCADLAASRGDSLTAHRLFHLARTHGRRAGIPVARLLDDEIAPRLQLTGEACSLGAGELDALPHVVPLEELPLLLRSAAQ